jgi:hypothetical protein
MCWFSCRDDALYWAITGTLNALADSDTPVIDALLLSIAFGLGLVHSGSVGSIDA